MNVLPVGNHPTFDSLSAAADLSDIDAARSGVSRHVEQCAACAAIVAEIRELGESARAMEVAAVSADLWTRIEREARDPARAADDASRAIPVSDERTGAPERSDAVSTNRTVVRNPNVVRAGVALAATGALTALLLMPSPLHRQLQAAGNADVWRFSPANPMPGTTVRVRLEPVAKPGGAETLVLLGSEGRGGTPGGAAYAEDAYRSGLDDSLTTLRRGPDGAYEGTLRAPARHAALTLHAAPMGGPYYYRSWEPNASVSAEVRPSALLVGGDGVRPSLESLLSALQLGQRWGRSSVAEYAVADTLIKYHPTHPAGYANDRRVGGRRVLDDIIAYFNRGERQYVKFQQRLMPSATVSTDEALAMVTFANRLSEPGEARRWVLRLVREHPDDPRTLAVYAGMLYEMLNRAGTLDSVRRGLPLADTLFERNGRRDAGTGLADVALRAQDTAAYLRWNLRSWQRAADAPRGFEIFSLDRRNLHSPEVRATVRPALLRQLRASCDLPAGRYPAMMTESGWAVRCSAGRRAIFGALSTTARLDGDARLALSYADSALALLSGREACWIRAPFLQRGEALLALGDTAVAIPELVKGAASMNWQGAVYRDSIGLRLRPVVDSASWALMTSRASDEMQRCVTTARAR